MFFSKKIFGYFKSLKIARNSGLVSFAHKVVSKFQLNLAKQLISSFLSRKVRGCLTKIKAKISLQHIRLLNAIHEAEIANEFHFGKTARILRLFKSRPIFCHLHKNHVMMRNCFSNAWLKRINSSR